MPQNESEGVLEYCNASALFLLKSVIIGMKNSSAS